MFSRRTEIFVEFLLLGVGVGLIEDLIAIKLVTGETLTWHTVGIALLVALPFAFLGEVIVDRQHLIPVRHNDKPKAKKPR